MTTKFNEMNEPDRTDMHPRKELRAQSIFRLESFIDLDMVLPLYFSPPPSYGDIAGWRALWTWKCWNSSQNVYSTCSWTSQAHPGHSRSSSPKFALVCASLHPNYNSTFLHLTIFFKELPFSWAPFCLYTHRLPNNSKDATHAMISSVKTHSASAAMSTSQGRSTQHF